MLFSTASRLDSSAKRAMESEFQFLDRSADAAVSAVRSFLEAAVLAYPEAGQQDLVARIKSGRRSNFDSACFELLLYSILSRLNFKLEPHPTLPNGSANRPDFLVSTPDGHQLYLEAVLATANDGSDPGAEARKSAALDALNAANHRDFILAIEHRGEPGSQPSGRKLVAAALKWLDTLKWESVIELAKKKEFDALPETSWEHEGWHVTMKAIPLKAEARGSSSAGLIGTHMGEGGSVDAWSPIRDAVRHKGSFYGELDKPLLVAVNSDTFHLEAIDEMQALYGQEQFVFAPGSSEEPRFRRARNGAWIGKNGPQSRRVSGVWSFNDLNPYSIAGRRNTLYWNPWALRSLPESLKCFPRVELVDTETKRFGGLSIRDVFGLSAEWPG